MENESHNLLYLSGRICSDITFSHESHGTEFFAFCLESKRLSGTYDVINMLIKKTALDEMNLSDGTFIKTLCELRSHNKKTENGNRLIVSAFIKEIETCEDDTFENALQLTGTICKTPGYRKTPLGREICDIMLAINRKYGRSDYLPLVIWGRNARVARTLNTGDVITIHGRIQSREYTKIIDGEETIRTAYEVSVSSLELVPLETD